MRCFNSFLPAPAVPPLVLHSFPTRRSSDLSASRFTVPPAPLAGVVAIACVTARPRLLVAFRSEEHTSELQALTQVVCGPPVVKKTQLAAVVAGQVSAPAPPTVALVSSLLS